MPVYKIFANGVDMGCYSGRDRISAVEGYFRCAGYYGIRDAAAQMEMTPNDLWAELRIVPAKKVHECPGCGGTNLECNGGIDLELVFLCVKCGNQFDAYRLEGL